MTLVVPSKVEAGDLVGAGNPVAAGDPVVAGDPVAGDPVASADMLAAADPVATGDSVAAGANVDALAAPAQSPISLVELDCDWRYRGEGGANLVISLPRRRVVLRFAKSKYAKDQDRKVAEMAHFANAVMRPLLGPTFVRPVSLGAINMADFERVRVRAQPFRPPGRCKKDIASRRVIISPDCVFLTSEYECDTFGETFSVEIKPKQGWHSLKATCSVDLCHRCLKQHAKLFSGEIGSISEYCPLDLFSGDKARMKRAVFDLCESPCNRFKLFKNGDLIYTEGVGELSDVEREMGSLFSGLSPLDSLAALLCTALLSPLEEFHSKQWSVDESFVSLDPRSSVRSKVCDTHSLPLPDNCILQRLLTLQRHTDISDADAKVLCDWLLSTIDDLEGFQQLMLWQPNTKLEHQLSQKELDQVLQLQRFLLSVTAKDVSLLITFRQVEEKQKPTAAPTFHFRSLDKSFRVMISVIDLDPKPVHRIATWVKRKEEWLQTYFHSIKQDGSSSLLPAS